MTNTQLIRSVIIMGISGVIFIFAMAAAVIDHVWLALPVIAIAAWALFGNIRFMVDTNHRGTDG